MHLTFLLVLLCVSAAQASTLNISIVSPASLHSRFPYGQIRSRAALFGIAPWGAPVQGRVALAANAGCERGDFALVPVSDEQHLALVWRGNCSFVIKVRNAQMAGYNAAVVLDNSGSQFLPYMRDDGTGGDVVIPSAITDKQTGDALVAALHEAPVVMSLAVPAVQPNNGTVRLQLFTSAVDSIASELKQNLWQVLRKFKATDRVETQVYFRTLVWPSSSYPCAPQQDCTNGGRYVFPQRGALPTGQDVLTEQLRQSCLLSVLEEHESEKWWVYASLFEQHCAHQFQNWTASGCGNSLLPIVMLPKSPKLVDTCMSESGGITADVRNPVFDEQVTAFSHGGVATTPWLVIDGQLYTGSFACALPFTRTSCPVLGALCRVLEEPSLCGGN